MLTLLHSFLQPAGARRSIVPLMDLCSRLNLPLSKNDLARLICAHSDALQSTGRIEYEPRTLEGLLSAFHDSPYLISGETADTLCELTELFYRLKNETDDRIPDDDLLACMRRYFDEYCHGSVELLADMLERGLL